jgi:glutamate racemase
MKIGVFDSGVGGLSMANAIKRALPDDEVVLREDKAHVPYGNRQPVEILGFIIPIFQSLVDEGCQVIVVACNTVSTTLIEELRRRFSVPLIAIEPMIKPAAAITKTKVIAVCATPTTLASKRYAQLKQEYADGLTVLEPDCGDWALMIEEQQVYPQKIEARINEVPHYHWIEEEIVTLSRGKATVLQPEQAIVAQLKRVLARLD